MAFSSGSSPMASIRSRMASMRAPFVGWKKRASSQKVLVNQPACGDGGGEVGQDVDGPVGPDVSRSAWT